MKKKGIVSDYVPWLILLAVVIVIFVTSSGYIKTAALALLEKIKSIFRT